MQTLKVKKLNPQAQLPKRATDGSAGYDLCVCQGEEVTIKPGETHKFQSGIAIELEAGFVGLIYPRSGLGTKFGISLPNSVGVIDSDYRGEIGLALHNYSSEPYTVKLGERVAQLVVTPYFAPEIQEVDELSDTERGSGGFGSTGK